MVGAGRGHGAAGVEAGSGGRPAMRSGRRVGAGQERGATAMRSGRRRRRGADGDGVEERAATASRKQGQPGGDREEWRGGGKFL